MPSLSSTERKQKNEKRKRESENSKNLNVLSQKYPKIQNNEKVGTREVVENRKAIATRVEGDITGKTVIGLTEKDIIQKEIEGQTSEYNKLNVAKLSNEKKGFILKQRDPSKIKIRNISEEASKGANRRNNWVIYIKQIIFHTNRFGQPLKYPSLVSNHIVQMAYHMQVTNKNSPSALNIAIAPYLVAAILVAPEFSNFRKKLDEKNLLSPPVNLFDLHYKIDNNTGTPFLPQSYERMKEIYDNFLQRLIIENSIKKPSLISFYEITKEKIFWDRFRNYEKYLENERNILKGFDLRDNGFDQANELQSNIRVQRVNHKTPKDFEIENLDPDFLGSSLLESQPLNNSSNNTTVGTVNNQYNPTTMATNKNSLLKNIYNTIENLFETNEEIKEMENVIKLDSSPIENLTDNNIGENSQQDYDSDGFNNGQFSFY